MGHQIHPIVISAIPEFITGRDRLRSWQNFHVGFLICEVGDNMFGKTKLKYLVLPMPRKTVNQNSITLLEDLQKLVTIQF